MKCPNCNNKLELQPYLIFKCNNCNKTFKGDIDFENETATLTEVFSVPSEGWKFDNKQSIIFYYEINKTGV